MAHTKRLPPPTLTSDIVADEDKLSEAIERLLLADRRQRLYRSEITRRQAELRALVDDGAWAAYLEVEQAVNARLADALVKVARWAFAQGRR
jgi:hypothetical protein